MGTQHGYSNEPETVTFIMLSNLKPISLHGLYKYISAL